MTKKILIVEDEVDILRLLSTILSSFGDYGIFCASDGQEALRIAREESPDIIILDIQLPGMNGYDVCKLIRSDPAISDIKVLMLSGMTQDSDWQKAQEVGADGYIAKPFSSIALVEKVEKLLRSN
jgi:CheY-like chemotaxis protein